MTKSDLLQKLRSEEETVLLEMLGVTSSDLVDAFLDIIEERYKYLDAQYSEKE